nr:hypothetical protein [Tanacetum cinerariifolium]
MEFRGICNIGVLLCRLINTFKSLMCKFISMLIVIKQGLDPTYNEVQFKLYETEPLNWEGGPVKFETVKWIPPEILAKIRVLMSVRFYLECLHIQGPWGVNDHQEAQGEEEA